MQSQKNTGLTQSEIDGLVNASLDQIIHVKQCVERIDDKRDRLADWLETALASGQVNIALRNDRGVLIYSHWIGDHNRVQSRRMIDEVYLALSSDLLRQRAAVFAAPKTQPMTPYADPETPLFSPSLYEKEGDDKPAPVQETARVPVTDEQNLTWLSRLQVSEELGLNVDYVSVWASNKKLNKRREGRNVLYGVPPNLMEKYKTA